jgi:hypothetical protein
MARKRTNEENEKLKWYDLEYGEKHRKMCKMRNKHYRACNMARNLKNVENEKLTW